MQLAYYMYREHDMLPSEFVKLPLVERAVLRGFLLEDMRIQEEQEERLKGM